MKFKSKIKLLILLCALICLICSIFVVRNTFARYVTALKTQSYVELGSWLITINDQNVVDNSNFVAKVTPVFSQDSDYIAENTIVPTSTGYVDLNIDYSNVKVPFTYTLTLSQDAASFIEDLKLTGYYMNGSLQEYSGTDITLTNTIIPNGVVTNHTYKFNFEWIDGEGSGETLDAAEDTKASRDFQNIKLNFDIAFTQIH